MTAPVAPPPDPTARARRAIGGMFFVNGAVYASWVSRLPALRERLGLDDRALGLLLVATAVGALAAFRIAGPLIARFTSRTVTRCAATAMSILVALVGLAASPVAMAAALGGLGAASGLMDVAMNAHGVEVERRCRRPILSSLHGLFSLGALAGAGAGALAAAVGMTPAIHLAVIALVAVATVWPLGRALLLGDPASAAPAPDDRGVAREPQVARRRLPAQLIALGMVAFCSAVDEGAMADWSAVYLRDALGTSEAVAALAYAAFSVAMLVGRFSGDAVILRLGAARVVRSGGIVVALGLLTGLAINTPAAMTAGVACVGLGLAAVVPTVFRAGARVPGVAPGAALATIATLSYGGFLAGPPVIGWVAGALTLRVGLVVVAALALVLAVLAPVVGDRAPR